MDNNKKNLDALKKAEEAFQNDQMSDIEETTNVSSNSQDSDTPNTLDGYKIIENYNLPQEGKLYPEHWTFAYRCPEAGEVANFSTIASDDRPGMLQAIEDLIRKCVIIWDTNKNIQVSSGEICDSHRTFFMLLLRDYYLPGTPITYTSLCSVDQEPMNIKLTYKNLIYSDIKEKILECFDGRRFTFVFDDEEIEISFLIPTLNTSSKVFKYLMRTYKNNQSDKDKIEEKIVYDKKFLLLAPYLFQTGKEAIKDIIARYNEILKNDKKLEKYIEIITKLKLEHFDYIEHECEKCGSEEEAPLRFPGGWKELFVKSSKYFD